VHITSSFKKKKKYIDKERKKIKFCNKTKIKKEKKKNMGTKSKEYKSLTRVGTGTSVDKKKLQHHLAFGNTWTGK